MCVGPAAWEGVVWAQEPYRGRKDEPDVAVSSPSLQLFKVQLELANSNVSRTLQGLSESWDSSSLPFFKVFGQLFPGVDDVRLHEVGRESTARY